MQWETDHVHVLQTDILAMNAAVRTNVSVKKIVSVIKVVADVLQVSVGVAILAANAS
jgi:hypothetical protein